jgi:pre-mRNA-splicing factor SYF1
VTRCAFRARRFRSRSFQSLAGKTKHQLWLELCDIITKHPAEVQSLPVEGILRGGIRKFTDEVGRLWTSLADYYIRRALFERARDIYEVWFPPP